MKVTVKVRSGESRGAAMLDKIRDGLETAHRALDATINTLADAPHFKRSLATKKSVWKRFQWSAWTFLKCDVHRNRKKTQEENSALARLEDTGEWNPFSPDQFHKISNEVWRLRYCLKNGEMTIKVGFPGGGGRFCVWWLSTFQEGSTLEGLVKSHFSTSQPDTGPAKKNTFLGIPVVKGDIHLPETILGKEDSQVAHIILHEACHKYLDCNDVNVLGAGYFDEKKGEFPRRLTRSESFNNADSIALFCMTVGNEFEDQLGNGGAQNGYESWGS